MVHQVTPLDSPLISVVVPLYNEEQNVSVFVKRIEGVFAKLSCRWELVLALDPSPDATRERILELIQQGYPIRLVVFSRRIGKPLSLLAGLDHARGDACIVMDVDLQDPPELIGEMLKKWQEGFKVVIAQRTERRGEHFLYLRAANLFYWLLEKISDVPVPRNTGDYRLLDARVVREICGFRERHAFLRGLSAVAGFRTTLIPFERDARFMGRTQIPIRGAVNIALDGIVPFSRAPVRLIFLLGVAVLVLTLGACATWTGVGVMRGFSDLWPLVLLSLVSLGLSGITLTALGILGEYLVRTYEEARDRPLYIVDELHEPKTLDRQ